MSWVDWLFNVTFNDISVIYVTAHRCAGGLKKLDLRLGFQSHNDEVEFILSSSCICTVLFYVRLGYCFTPYQRLWLYNGAPLVAFFDTLGIRRTLHFGIYLYWTNSKETHKCLLSTCKMRPNILADHVQWLVVYVYIFYLKRKRRRSDPVLWQNPLYQQKIRKPKDNTHKRHQKLWLHNDCGPT